MLAREKVNLFAWVAKLREIWENLPLWVAKMMWCHEWKFAWGFFLCLKCACCAMEKCVEFWHYWISAFEEAA